MYTSMHFTWVLISFNNFHQVLGKDLQCPLQAPRSTRTRSIRGSSRTIHSNIVAKQQASNIHWQSIVKSMDHTLKILSENYVSWINTCLPSSLFTYQRIFFYFCLMTVMQVSTVITRKIYSQVFSFINVQLFNR